MNGATKTNDPDKPISLPELSKIIQSLEEFGGHLNNRSTKPNNRKRKNNNEKDYGILEAPNSIERMAFQELLELARMIGNHDLDRNIGQEELLANSDRFCLFLRRGILPLYSLPCLKILQPKEWTDPIRTSPLLGLMSYIYQVELEDCWGREIETNNIKIRFFNDKVDLGILWENLLTAFGDGIRTHVIETDHCKELDAFKQVLGPIHFPFVASILRAREPDKASKISPRVPRALLESVEALCGGCVKNKELIKSPSVLGPELLSDIISDHSDFMYSSVALELSFTIAPLLRPPQITGRKSITSVEARKNRTNWFKKIFLNSKFSPGVAEEVIPKLVEMSSKQFWIGLSSIHNRIVRDHDDKAHLIPVICGNFNGRDLNWNEDSIPVTRNNLQLNRSTLTWTSVDILGRTKQDFGTEMNAEFEYKDIARCELHMGFKSKNGEEERIKLSFDLSKPPMIEGTVLKMSSKNFFSVEISSRYDFILPRLLKARQIRFSLAPADASNFLAPKAKPDLQSKHGIEEKGLDNRTLSKVSINKGFISAIEVGGSELQGKPAENSSHPGGFRERALKVQREAQSDISREDARPSVAASTKKVVPHSYHQKAIPMHPDLRTVKNSSDRSIVTTSKSKSNNVNEIDLCSPSASPPSDFPPLPQTATHEKEKFPSSPGANEIIDNLLTKKKRKEILISDDEQPDSRLMATDKIIRIPKKGPYGVANASDTLHKQVVSSRMKIEENSRNFLPEEIPSVKHKNKEGSLNIQKKEMEEINQGRKAVESMTKKEQRQKPVEPGSSENPFPINTTLKSSVIKKRGRGRPRKQEPLPPPPPKQSTPENFNGSIEEFSGASGDDDGSDKENVPIDDFENSSNARRTYLRHLVIESEISEEEEEDSKSRKFARKDFVDDDCLGGSSDLDTAVQIVKKSVVEKPVVAKKSGGVKCSTHANSGKGVSGADIGSLVVSLAEVNKKKKNDSASNDLNKGLEEDQQPAVIKKIGRKNIVNANFAKPGFNEEASFFSIPKDSGIKKKEKEPTSHKGHEEKHAEASEDLSMQFFSSAESDESAISCKEEERPVTNHARTVNSRHLRFESPIENPDHSRTTANRQAPKFPSSVTRVMTNDRMAGSKTRLFENYDKAPKGPDFISGDSGGTSLAVPVAKYKMKNEQVELGDNNRWQESDGEEGTPADQDDDQMAFLDQLAQLNKSGKGLKLQKILAALEREEEAHHLLPPRTPASRSHHQAKQTRADNAQKSGPYDAEISPAPPYKLYSVEGEAVQSRRRKLGRGISHDDECLAGFEAVLQTGTDGGIRPGDTYPASFDKKMQANEGELVGESKGISQIERRDGFQSILRAVREHKPSVLSPNLRISKNSHHSPSVKPLKIENRCDLVPSKSVGLISEQKGVRNLVAPNSEQVESTVGRLEEELGEHRAGCSDGPEDVITECMNQLTKIIVENVEKKADQTKGNAFETQMVLIRHTEHIMNECMKQSQQVKELIEQQSRQTMEKLSSPLETFAMISEELDSKVSWMAKYYVKHKEKTKVRMKLMDEILEELT